MQERKRSEKALRSFLPLICCPARTADKRTLGSGPLVNHPAPEALSPPLDSTPASGLTSLFHGKRCSMGHNASSFQDYRGIHQVSQPKTQEIRSLSEMQLARVRPFSFAEARGAAGKCQTWTERLAVHPLPRRSRKTGHGARHIMAGASHFDSEPLNMVMAPLIKK